METHVNRIRRHILLLAIFSNGKSCNKIKLLLAILEDKSIRRHLLLLAIFSHSGNKSY